MRNGVLRRRFSLFEALEQRVLLSAAGAGLTTNVTTERGAAGQFSVTAYDSTTGLDTQLAFLFQRDVLVSKLVTFDAYAIDVQIVDHATKALVAHFGEVNGSPTADEYQVALMTTDSTMRLVGTFILPTFGDTAVADKDATIMVDIAWSRQSIDRHIENTSLTIDKSSRELIDSARDEGPASVTASAAWVQPGPGLQKLLRDSNSLMSGERAEGTLETTISHTADLASSMNLTPLVQSLSPPAGPPTGSKVSSLSVQFGYAFLSPPENDPTGSIALYGNGSVADLGYGAVIDGGNAFINGQLGDGVTFTPDGLHASAQGEGTANIDGVGPGFVTVPFSLDIQWNARPDTLSLMLDRTITITQDTVSVAYDQVIQYTADVTGSWSIGDPAPHYNLANEGVLNLINFVTVVYPAQPGAHAGNAGDITPSEWRAVGAGPWRDAIELAKEEDLLRPSSGRQSSKVGGTKLSLVGVLSIPAVEERAMEWVRSTVHQRSTPRISILRLGMLQLAALGTSADAWPPDVT